MINYQIYLAGFISGAVLDKCIEWRTELKKRIIGASFLDPLGGQDLAAISLDGNDSDIPYKALTYRDYASVNDSDLIIANLETFNSDRSLTGTIAEISWAWMLRKPIIILAPQEMEGRSNYVNHPFIKTFASAIVDNLDDVVKFTNFFMKKDY